MARPQPELAEGRVIYGLADDVTDVDIDCASVETDVVVGA